MLPQLRLLLVATGQALGALAAFSFRINLLAHLDCHQSLYVCNVGKRTRKISVVRICFLEMLNGARKELQGFLIMSLAAHHASMSGINVAQRDVIVAVAQRCFGLVQNTRRFAELPFLE